MKLSFSDLWQWRGTIDRGEYAFWGCLLFAIKHNIDRLIATFFFNRRWAFFNYLVPADSGSILSITKEQAELYVTLLTIALPFIWAGVALTLRRLRSIGLPVWLVFFFFFPVLNLLFFLILSILPSAFAGGESSKMQRSRLLDRLIPDHPFGSAAVAFLVNVVSALIFVRFSVDVLKNYGWGLFVGLPFCLGFTAVAIYTYPRRRSYGNCVLVCISSAGLIFLALLAVAFEGVVCLIMAGPIVLLLTILGGTIAYFLQFRPANSMDTPPVLCALLLAVPLLIQMEHFGLPESDLLEVKTSLEIQAPPERVWQQVVAFSQLPEPSEWVFRIGIAFPVRAEMNGAGVGAVRHCVFSTGKFTEPIEVWQEPRLLRFSVSSNPPPMQEWMPYSKVHPLHLNGFLVSRGGQFLLTRLPNGRTLLEGTTWYQHHMRPSLYWQVWSDFLIHKIHLRVLKHIQIRAESKRNF